MKQTAKIALFNSIFSILLCLVLITNATMALFSSQSTVNIAITSGSVRVVATPTLEKASSAEWDDTEGGYLYPDLPIRNNSATFTPGGTASIDDDGNVVLNKIMPGDSATVRIEIRNLSTIDIKYQLTATFGDETSLLNILEITLSCDNTDLEIFSGSFSHLAPAGQPDKASKWLPLSAAESAARPTAATLELKIAFPMSFSLETAAYAGKSASIALTVNAVQGNAPTDDPVEPETNEFVPASAKYTVGALDEGKYKILEAKEESGYEFLYWAFQKGTSGAGRTAAGASVTTNFGEYLTSNPVYKFRVTPDTYGTYQAVYRNTKDTSKLIRLSKASPLFTVGSGDVDSEITLIAEAELWDTFDRFTRAQGDDVEELQCNDLFMYTFTPKSGDVGAIYEAHYIELDLEHYEDYFDNTGAIDYEATILNPDVERKVPEGYGSGGIDEQFTEGEFAGVNQEKYGNQTIGPEDYPIYGKGYTKFSNKTTGTAEYKQNNELVFDETKALAEVGNYFIDKEGNLWGEKEYTSEEAWTLYNAFLEAFTREHDLPSDFIENEEKYKEEYGEETYNKWQADFSTYILDKMQHDGSVWIAYGHLYRHLESKNMYLGDVDDKQPAVEKRISATPRGTTQGWSPTITGLYAPAGEVITFKMSKDDMERTGGMIVTIGMVQMPGIPLIFGVEKYPIRPARITAQTTITPNTKHPDEVPFYDEETGEYTFYFGSYLGGPIYVSPVNAGAHFTIDIKGAVEYQHYIYGYTTKQEFEAREKTTAPYFECWVAPEDVRFVGPRSQVTGASFTFENYLKVSRLWENAARISKRFPSQSNSEYGIMVMFEAYVQSGAACAFAGANTVDSPYGWMGGALSYESIVEYGGWGNFHEFNHCYQYFGIGADSEVSNNTVNLVEYALLTEISAHRAVDADGISTRYTGWESYTDPAFTLRVLTGGNPANGSRDKNLCRYVNLFYSFGLDRYVEMTQITSHDGGQIWGSSKGAYPFFKGACEGSGYNMEYYFNEIIFPENDKDYGKYHINLENTYLKNDYETKYQYLPMFVPVACTYQTGVGHAFDPETGKGVDALTENDKIQWEYTTTSRPFRIDFNKPFTLDFEHTLAIPGRSKDTEWQDTQFDWEIELTSEPAYGNVVTGAGRNFIYTPDENSKKAGTSGSMIFTVKYKGKADSPATKDIQGSVQIVVEFDATPGTTRVYDLDRTVYTYAEDMVEGGDTEAQPAAIDETKSPFETEYDKWMADLQGNGKAYDGTFSGAMYVTTEENVIPESVGEQNNTALYFDEDHPAPTDSFIVVNGIYTPKTGGEYYLGLESIGNSALYVSTDGKTYTLLVTCGPDAVNAGGAISGNSAGVYRAAAKLTLTAEKPVYFREVFVPDQTDPNHGHVKMLWGQSGIGSTDDLTDTPEGEGHEGCAYCVKDVSESYELEYLETRDQYFFEKTTATQEMVKTIPSESSGGITFDDAINPMPGAAKASPEFFFDGNPYTPFIVSGIGSGRNLTIIGKMCDSLTGEVTSVTADSFILQTDADEDPHSYKLYVGDSKDKIDTLVFEQDWSQYGSRPRLQRLGTLEHLFKDGEQTFKYYKLEVTQTGGRLVLYGIEFGRRWNVKQPSDRDVEKLGAWDNVRTSGSTFGYLLTANGATEKEPVSSLTMTFTGTEFHIRALVGAAYGAVEILLDGKSVADIDLRNFDGEGFQEIFKMLDLENTEHTLVLRSVEKFNIDAVYYR